MPTAAPEFYEAYSRRDKDRNPIVGTCTVLVADGNVKVEFKDGYAEVTPAQAAALASHPDVTVPGYTPGHPVDAVTRKPIELTEEQHARAAEVRLDRSRPAGVDRDRKVQDAIEYLQEEGEDVPEPIAKTTSPAAGFEALTADGQKRCQAAKGDGTQCSNPVTDGIACGLPKHREQLGQQ